MEEIYNLNISDNTLSTMLEINPEINDLSREEILDKIELLKSVNCNNYQITNIISSNPIYLSKINEDILLLIKKLNDLFFSSLNILFDANPYILNLDSYEIDNYINNRVNNGEKVDNIVDDLDTNPYLFNEM